MGIVKQARDAAVAAFNAFVTATSPSRAQKRKWWAAVADLANEWLAKFDKQDAEAAQSFAASKKAQYDSFVDTLPDVTLDPVDPQS